jgi:hypothetical protein
MLCAIETLSLLVAALSYLLITDHSCPEIFYQEFIYLNISPLCEVYVS